MDVALGHDRKQLPAVTVRQFAASRIEKQLLTQVFELLCNPLSRVEHSQSPGRMATNPRSETEISNERGQCETPFARRRAA